MGVGYLDNPGEKHSSRRRDFLNPGSWLRTPLKDTPSSAAATLSLLGKGVPRLATFLVLGTSEETVLTAKAACLASSLGAAGMLPP